MDSNTHLKKIQIRPAHEEDLYDINLCAKEFIDFFENFKIEFMKNKFFILTAYSKDILAGLLIAENKTDKIDALEKIVPNMHLHLLYVNPNFRKKNIGKSLLNSFFSIQRRNGIASIYIKLPQKYRDGINFFLKNNFHIIDKVKNKIILEFALWNDYGIRECQIIEENFNDMF